MKLLRVLQEREFERLGGTQSVRVNVRLVAATHRPLEKLIAEGLFREDLFYRLNVFTVFAPPLRERKPDIMLLADHFLQKFSSEHSKAIKRISTPAIDMLTSYHWPGNVRELENTIERAVLVCDGGVVHAHHLPPTLQTAEASDTVPRVSLVESVEAFEKDLILDALKTTRGNRARAAKLLGTTERIFNYKVRKYRVNAERIQETDAAAQGSALRQQSAFLRSTRNRSVGNCSTAVLHSVGTVAPSFEPLLEPRPGRAPIPQRFISGRSTSPRTAGVGTRRAVNVAQRTRCPWASCVFTRRRTDTMKRMIGRTGLETMRRVAAATV